MLTFRNLSGKPEDCSCPACRAAGPRTSPLRRVLAHNLLLALNEPAADVAPEPSDLRAAIDARNASTSKNVVNRPGPEPKYPSRPGSSPFEDSLARDVFATGQLVESPTNDPLVAAIRKVRS